MARHIKTCRVPFFMTLPPVTPEQLSVYSHSFMMTDVSILQFMSWQRTQTCNNHSQQTTTSHPLSLGQCSKCSTAEKNRSGHLWTVYMPPVKRIQNTRTSDSESPTMCRSVLECSHFLTHPNFRPYLAST